MPIRYCCAECIGDRHLRKNVIPSVSQVKGECAYCGSENQPLVVPTDLRVPFELLIDAYARDDGGQTLVEWLKRDWALFDHVRMDGAHAKDLLGDILDDGDIVRRNFAALSTGGARVIERWNELRAELMHKNRFFPVTTIDMERLGRLLPSLKLDEDELPKIWYRARIQQSSEAYPIDQMGCPPKHLASHGRANPAGIPYLYLASKEITAISEVRPSPGDTVAVAKVEVQNLEIIDLRNPRKTFSPFSLPYEDTLSSFREDLDFLEKLGEELSRPVLQKSAAFDYIPSQYLCEFVKKCGFGGVMYRSAAEGGVNLALFNPDQVNFVDMKSFYISRVSVEL
jgi:hypothetical protein